MAKSQKIILKKSNRNIINVNLNNLNSDAGILKEIELLKQIIASKDETISILKAQLKIK